MRGRHRCLVVIEATIEAYRSDMLEDLLKYEMGSTGVCGR